MLLRSAAILWNSVLVACVLSLFHMNARAETPAGEAYSLTQLAVQTADGVKISGILYDGGNDRVIIYCHRLLGSQDGKEVKRILAAFIDEYDLITFDFRGHKASARMSSSGGDEVLDLRAVTSLAVKAGYTRVVVLGAGMGGSVAIRGAGLFGNMDALIAVSPSGVSPKLQPFFVRQASHIALDTDFGTVPLRIITNTRLGTRYTAGYPNVVMAAVPRIPVLVVQSKNDRFLKSDRLRDAFGDALDPRDFVVVPGRRHANRLLVESTLSTIRDWLNGLFPEQGYEDSPLYGERETIVPPDTSEIGLFGDLPIPEEMILGDYYQRSVRSSEAPRDPQTGPEGILKDLKEVFSYHGYTVTSFALSDSVAPFEIRVSIPEISSVSISGNRWITDAYIRQIMKVAGGYYNSYEIDKAVRRLASEPAIQTVTPSITKREDGDVDLHLEVVERRPYRLLLSTKFTEVDEFFGLGITWNEYNPSGIQLDGQAMYGVRDRDILSSFGMAKNLWRNNIRLGARYFNIIKSRDDVEYVYTRQEVRELGGEFTASYRMTSTITVNVGVFGKEHTSPGATADSLVEEGIAAGSVLKLDVGGKLPLHGPPRFHWGHTFYYQRTGLGGQGDFDFNTYQLNFSGDLPLWGDHRSVSSFHYGWISGNAPPQEHFSLGGMTTLPGYPDDSFVDTRMMRASQAVYLCASSWLPETSRFSPLRFIFSFNAGTVWGEGDSLEASDLKMDAGFEIDYEEILRLGIAVPVGSNRLESPRYYLGWGIHVL
jgi:pimeloyl-ACP methyl ester carboxylesterase